MLRWKTLAGASFAILPTLSPTSSKILSIPCSRWDKNPAATFTSHCHCFFISSCAPWKWHSSLDRIKEHFIFTEKKLNSSIWDSSEVRCFQFGKDFSTRSPTFWDTGTCHLEHSHQEPLYHSELTFLTERLETLFFSTFSILKIFSWFLSFKICIWTKLRQLNTFEKMPELHCLCFLHSPLPYSKGNTTSPGDKDWVQWIPRNKLPKV